MGSPVIFGSDVIGFDAKTTVLHSDLSVDMFTTAVSDEVEFSVSSELHRQ